MDAEDPQLADEGVAHHLENVCQYMFVGIGFGVEWCSVLVAELSGEERWRVAFGRVRRKFCQRVEQLGNPGAGAGGDEQDRD